MISAAYSLLNHLGQRLKAHLDQEEPYLFYWTPVAFGLGIALYFSLTFEPTWTTLGKVFIPTTLIALSLCALTYKTGHLWYRRVGICILLTTLGFSHIKYRADSLKTPQLRGTLSYAPFHGTVDTIERLSNGTRLTLQNVHFQKTYRKDLPLPHKIRVTYRGSLQPDLSLMPGDRVASIAGLSPPSPPITPRSYDFRRKAYFEGIGAVGYGIQTPHKLAHSSNENKSVWDELRIKITKERYNLSTFIRTQVPGQSGAIMSALVTGDRSGISKATREAFANSGIAHILAISGLHLSLVAGIIFFLIRRGLSFFPTICLHFNTKKMAAVCALLVTFVYLYISGVTIPAQRAFMMTAIVLLAVLTNRIALTLRNVALAALVVMVIKPETITGPSFQLSFAAVTALVCFYEQSQNYLSKLSTAISESRFSFAKRLLFYIATLLVTSLIATLATLPLTIFTFNRFSLVAVFSNLLAIPLVSFVIMPLVVASLIISIFIGPWGFSLFSPLLSIAIDLLQSIAHYGDSLPGSLILVPTVPASIQTIIILSLIWISLIQSSWRLYSLPILFISLVSIPFWPKPSLFVTADQSIWGLYDHSQVKFSQKRRGTFARENWLKSIGMSDFDILKLSPPFTGIKLSIHGYDLHATTKDVKTYNRKYYSTQLTLMNPRLKTSYPVTPKMLKTHGSHEIWLRSTYPKIITNYDITGLRPWALYQGFSHSQSRDTVSKNEED